MQTFNYGSYIDTDPILRYYENINNFNATQTLKLYDNTNINTDPIFRSYDQILEMILFYIYILIHQKFMITI